MNIDSICNGYVLDHITRGNALKIYNYLRLGELECCAAIITNVKSNRMGRKDILKIDALIPLNFDALGYIDRGITVNIIKDGQRIEKRRLELPERIVNIIKCKNPRCITSTEQALDHVFRLVDRDKRVYRCIYCESSNKKSDI